MFESESAYKVTQLGTGRFEDTDLQVGQRIYKFTTSDKHVYHIIVDEFKDDFFVVKFYPAVLKNLGVNKYHVLFPCSTPSRIIGTVFHHMLSILNTNNDASFIICGAHRINEDGSTESRENNLRFRIYRKLTISTIDPASTMFSPLSNPKTGYYILVNNQRHSDLQATVAAKVREFSEVYSDQLFPEDFINESDKPGPEIAGIG